MKRRPWPLIILALFHCLSPFGNKISNALWSSLPVWTYLRVSYQWPNIEKNWPEFVFPVIAGIAIYLCRRWSFYIYLTAMLSLFVSSYIGYQGRGYSVILELIAVYSINLLLVGYFLIPSVRRVYFNPRLRWWETARRYRAEMDAVIVCQSERFTGFVNNISKSGLFMKSAIVPPDKETVKIEFSFKNTKYHFSGTVIRHSDQQLVGFGIQFDHTLVSAKAAKALVQSLEDDGRLIESRLPSKDEGFWNWLKTLARTGQGLTPQISEKQKSHRN
jgi:hypothetical protein